MAGDTAPFFGTVDRKRTPRTPEWCHARGGGYKNDKNNNNNNNTISPVHESRAGVRLYPPPFLLTTFGGDDNDTL